MHEVEKKKQTKIKIVMIRKFKEKTLEIYRGRHTIFLLVSLYYIKYVGLYCEFYFVPYSWKEEYHRAKQCSFKAEICKQGSLPRILSVLPSPVIRFGSKAEMAECLSDCQLKNLCLTSEKSDCIAGFT